MGLGIKHGIGLYNVQLGQQVNSTKAAKKQNLSGGPGWFDAADL